MTPIFGTVSAVKIARFVAGIAICLLAVVLAGVASAGVSRHVSTTKVTVTFTDTSLRVAPDTHESGATTFVVLNTGKKHHVLVIAGPGVKGVHTANLAGGTSAKLTVTLRSGTYVFSDPVGLGIYDTQFLTVIRAATLSGKGNTNVVTPPVALPPMCGQYYTP
jgi:hypothetical protein